MTFFNDTFCQTCERFITKEQWNNHLVSSRQLHRDVNAYHPTFFPQRKLFRDENIIHENVLWKMFIADLTNHIQLIQITSNSNSNVHHFPHHTF